MSFEILEVKSVTYKFGGGPGEGGTNQPVTNIHLSEVHDQLIKACREKPLGWCLALVNIPQNATVAAVAAPIVFKGSWPTLPPTPFYICYKIVHMFISCFKKLPVSSISFWVPYLFLYAWPFPNTKTVLPLKRDAFSGLCSMAVVFMYDLKEATYLLEMLINKAYLSHPFSAAMLALIFIGHLFFS